MIFAAPSRAHALQVIVLLTALALLFGCERRSESVAVSPGAAVTAGAFAVTMRTLPVRSGAASASSDEAPRRFIVSAPHAKGPWPVVIVLHGGGMTGEGMRAYADLEARASSRAIFVYPDAVVRNVWADEYALHWDGTKDLAFMDAIVRTLTAPPSADAAQGDARRVYAFGLSSGAYFANQLACAWGGRLAGFAAIEGGGPFGECSGPVSALIVHDPRDPVVPASEGDASLSRWLSEDNCGAAPSPYDLACKIHACAEGARVAMCRSTAGVHGLGPGAREAALHFFGL